MKKTLVFILSAIASGVLQLICSWISLWRNKSHCCAQCCQKRCLFKMAFYRRDSVWSSSGISEVNRAREGNGLVRVAEELLPVLTCSPAAVSTSQVLSPQFLYCFLQSCKAFVSACCVPSKILSAWDVWRQWYLLWGRRTSVLWKCTLLTCFLNLFCSAAVQVLEGSHGISSLCVYKRACHRVCCFCELSWKEKSKSKKVDVAGTCIWDW